MSCSAPCRAWPCAICSSGASRTPIVIRGFGNGGHGGDLGAVIDGIPLNEAMSHADGYVDLNVIIPLEIDSFTVLKGPVSALYGNYNRGGHGERPDAQDRRLRGARPVGRLLRNVRSARARTAATSAIPSR